MDEVTGYAVAENGKLLPRTVCETVIGAMVNYLIIEYVASRRGVTPAIGAVDQLVRQEYIERAPARGATIHRVSIKPMVELDPSTVELG